MLTQKEILEKINIKERLLRFWIKEYKLKKYVLSKKTGNLYNENILYFLKSIKFLKDTDIFSTNGIKNIIKELKKEKKDLLELNTLIEYSEAFSKKIYEEKLSDEVKDIEYNTDLDTKDDEDNYIQDIMKAERFIEAGNNDKAVLLLKEVSEKSQLYNRIAFEMLSMIKEGK